ncbi:MAG: aldo/keto reductase [Acidobacteriota bacterium]|nr:aldo/keto reductase [Acidobacteriota bacterium]
METRKLGNSDLQVTPIGFGAWAIGGSGYAYGWGAQKDKDSVGAIRRALELGINWIDTAPVYGLGHSEEVVARALAEWSGPRPYVFTKCGLRWDRRGNISRVLAAESIRRECEESLRRLRTEAIDLYQMHWPAGNCADVDEGWGAMARLREEGKVRWIGVSNFDAWQLKRAQRIAPVTSLQPPYSLLKREVEAGTLPYCRQEGIGVIVYSPMASGLLTGAMTRERVARLPRDDWRRNDVEFSEPKLSRHLELVERLRKVGARHGRMPGEVAIAWALRHPAVTGAIVGARSAKQIEGIAGAADFRLTDKEVREIEEGTARTAGRP